MGHELKSNQGYAENIMITLAFQMEATSVCVQAFYNIQHAGEIYFYLANKMKAVRKEGLVPHYSPAACTGH
jgi:hypothetical protein